MKKIDIEKYKNLILEISKLAQKVAIDNDAELVDIAFSVEFNKLNLNVFVFKKGGVDLDILEAVHNELSSALDTIDDKFDTDYILNVSSPGLDRPIETDDDFRRALDTEIEVILLDGTKPHGKLLSYNEDTITLETIKNKIKTNKNFERNNIQKAQPFVKF